MRTITQGLYRFTAEQIDNQIAQEIGRLPVILAQYPHRAAIYANEIHRLRGQHATVDYLERTFVTMEDWAVSQNWTKQQLLLALYDEVLSLALSAPEDIAGGRQNDGQRSFNDGRREVLLYVARRLRSDEHFPGNNNESKGN